MKKLLTKEERKNYVLNMLKIDPNEFIFHFGDFKSADMWINSPWKLGEYKKICYRCFRCY